VEEEEALFEVARGDLWFSISISEWVWGIEDAGVGYVIANCYTIIQTERERAEKLGAAKLWIVDAEGRR